MARRPRRDLDRWPGHPTRLSPLLVEEIRSVPGFERFLAPPSTANLGAAASMGPVVVVTVSESRSDALVLSPTGHVDVVALPLVSPAAVREQVDALLGSVSGGEEIGADRERHLDDVLRWLWDAVAAPVMDRLSLTGPPREGEQWPRLWWCPSGPMAYLPLHAAGHHYRPHETVIDRVVSSYAATLQALIQAQQAAGADGPIGRRAVVVAMPRTPVPDPVASRVVRHVYSSLLFGCPADGAARALHDATRQVRATAPTRRSAWAAYVHSGP